MSKLISTAFFSFFQLVLIAQTAFSGDITDRNYINRFGYLQIVKSETNAEAKSKTVKTIYNFGENGYLVEKTVQGKETLTSQYAYDENGNVLEINTKLPNGKLVITEKYKYDNLNRLKESETRRLTENVKITEKMEWIDVNTRHLTHTTHDKDVKILTSYDKYNRPLSEVLEDATLTEWSYWGNIPVMKKVKNGDQIATIERYDFDTEMRIATIETGDLRKNFTYDDRGLLLKTETFDNNDALIASEKYEYVQEAK